MICKLPISAASAAFLLLAVTPGLSRAQNGAHPTKKPVIGTPASSHTVILSGAKAANLFPKGTQFWTPTPADIAQLETDLSLLSKKTTVPYVEAGKKAWNIVTDYNRQYIGILQGGKKRIYVNAFWAGSESEFPYWKHLPVLVKDGGNYFYHVTYEVKAHRFDAVLFNGLG